eukprot:4822684-Pyramimonas_sp.AAC.1
MRLCRLLWTLPPRGRGGPREPSRPLQLTRAEGEVHMCPREGVQRLRKLRNEAIRLRRGDQREVITCRCPQTQRKVIYTTKHLVVDGRETEGREEWKEEIDKFVRFKVPSEEVRNSTNTMMEESRMSAAHE